MRTNRLLDPPATRFRTALLVAFALSLAMSGTALAKGPGRPGGKSCTPVAPTALVDNNWAWSESGSWGYPGQQLAYFINVINYDVGCAAGTFVIDVHAPTGFQVTVPTNTISLKASTNGYLWAYVTSPTTVASGDYPLTVTVARAGASPSASATSYYKVYTADSVAPTLFWANPGEGQVLDGRSVSIAVSSKDDHAVSRIELDVDGVFVASTACDNVTYICDLHQSWPAATGQHTATFRSYDWMGNSGTHSVTFTVGSRTSATSSSSSTTTLESTPKADRGATKVLDAVSDESDNVGGKSRGKGDERGGKK